MRTKSTKYIFAFMLLISVLVISACSGEKDKDGANEETPARAQEITVRIADDPDFLDPHLMTASITEMMMLNIFEGLLAPETDGTLKPGVAEEYEVSDDGLTYTFKLRENIKFHNGDPVKIEDVKYTFERLMGVGNDETLSSKFKIVASLDAVDESTFKITLTEPNSTFLFSLTALDSAIIPKSNDGNHNESPIGTGPFKFGKYNPGSNLIVEKNEHYWKPGIPYLDKVTFTFQPDNQTALLSLQAGEVDLMDVPAHRIPEVENDFTLIYEEANSTVLVGYNMDRKPFNDIKVRQAINHAVNKDNIIEATFSGYAVKLGSNMSPAMEAAYKDGLQDYYDVNIEKAKELLTEAGYPDGFSTTISISSHNALYTNVAQVLVEDLKSIGIDVKIEVVEWGVWLERIYKGRDYDMTSIDFTGKLSPYDILNRYISDAGNNFLNFKNAEYDALMKDVIKESDIDQQNVIYKRAQEILAEEAAAVYIADYQFIWTMNPNLEGYKLYPFFYHDMSEVRFKE
ncbi:ABC transporter substrate-binding protein [Sporosarcina luteola]|uniref:ABC transporter substrate-binding protein n=1 Tax=Sporosarcina luteola TaxID=582850 RepID=UPI00203B03A7|nr:ABC transporter substrate-binding protein [Sporosarcina luteola]MCM3709195.1 ABC transporter substrate-binding protein [Sporosarcina luteola]